jgi:PAS domain S-box-containing protein
MFPSDPAAAAVLLRQFAAVAEASGEAVGVCDLELRPSYFNPAGRRMAGLSLDAPLAPSVLDFFYPEDQARLRDEIFPQVQREGRCDFETRLRRFDGGQPKWVACSIVLLTDEAGRPTGYGALSRDITDRRLSEEAVRAGERRLQMIFETLPVGVAVLDAAGEPLMANAEMQRFLPDGRIPSRDSARVGRWHAHDADGRAIPPEHFPGARALRGETVIPGQEMIFEGDDGRAIWTRIATRPIRGPDGAVEGVIVVVVDIDAAKRADARQASLIAELQHRVRNVLAVVRSVVRRTVETGDDLEDVAGHLEGRIAALARTQSLLARGADAGIDLEMLIREELLAQAADETRLEIEGASILLSSKAAEALTLAVHELATNATKYGALAQGGSISVTWTIEARDEGGDWLRLHWVERGVRVLAPSPRRRGFGTDLIEARIPYELAGEGRLEFLPGGLDAEICIPLIAGASVVAPPDDTGR